MADDVKFVDRSGIDEDCVTYGDRRCLDYFQSDRFIPEYRLQDIRPYLDKVRVAI